jgi:hypothetical protein
MTTMKKIEVSVLLVGTVSPFPAVFALSVVLEL